MHLHRHSSAVLHVDVDPELPAAGPRRRPHWLTERRMRAYSHTVLLCYFAFVGAYVVRLFGPHSTDLPRLTLDFTPIWSAAWLAAHGHALDAWQYAAVGAVELRAIPAMQAMPGGLPWLYPPTMLLWVLPLGWLPYMLAAALWLGGAYALFVAVCGAIVPRRTAMLCAFAFPGAFFATLIGQNSLLTAGLAGLGLLMLQRRPAAAGICFGLLTVKPQLAILFPLALLCAGQWRALAAWAATVAGGAALATLAFGPAAWLSFLHGISGTYQAVGNSQAILARIPTLHAMSMLAGWPAIATKGLEAVSALVAAAAVCYAWRGTCTYALRAATLACASLLASPYLFDYDLAWYGIVIAWYARHAFSHGWRRFDREWLVLLWLMPPAGAKLVDHLHVQFMPFVTIASLALLVARISRERHEAPCLPDAHDSATDTDFAHAARPHDAPPRLHRLDRPHLPRGSRH